MKRIIMLAVLLALSFLVIIIITQGVTKTVTVDINGKTMEIDTSAWTVSGVLQEQEIMLNERDSIEPPLSSLILNGGEIYLQQASWFTISENGSTQSVFGRFNDINELFIELEIEYSIDDVITLDGEIVSAAAQALPGVNHSIQIQREKTVSFSRGNSSQTFITKSPTLGAGLWSSDIVLNAGDYSNPGLDFPIQDSTHAEVIEAKEITIELSNEAFKSKSVAKTVGEALSDSGIALQGLDYSLPGVNSPVPEDGIIRVVRVKEEQFLESETIPFETESQPLSDLEIDNRSLVQAGVLGLKTRRIRVRYDDDQEVARQVEDEYISQPPQPEIIGYGTKIVPRTLDTPGGQIKYWRALEMYAVSYNVTSNGGYGTATGIPLAKGVAAIDPRYIPYGTRMYVPGYGEALAADTGGGIQGRMIDLGYLDEDYVSWHQWVTVYFLWPPPENVAWIIP